jgi:Fe-S-cluster-containing hydrogenase component 2
MSSGEPVGVNVIGVPTDEEFWKCPGVPSLERMKKGPVAVIECFQEIPCNVCELACPRGAIKVGHPITNLPVLDENRCVGCKLCIPVCPGLAIFVVDLSSDEAKVSLPYEMLPVPKVGEEVEVLDRWGRSLTKGRVVEVLYADRFDKTFVITVSLPKEYALYARNIRVVKRGER